MQIRVNFNQFSSFSLLKRPKAGGGERDRTDDLLVANQVLSQLSYTPEKIADFLLSKIENLKSKMRMVGLVGIEPTTSRLSGVRSNRD
jgi:hypothetical protein